MAAIIGEEALSSIDRAYLTFGRAFESKFVAQRSDEARTINQTLDLGWSILAHLPSQELTRVTPAEIQTHYQGKLDHSYGKTGATLANTE